jgi:type II secretory pathway pseudopilin PulG
MVKIQSSSIKTKAKAGRRRLVFILMFLLICVALLAGFVLQNLHLSIVKQRQSQLGLRSIPSAHVQEQQQKEQQQQQQKQQDAEPDTDDDQNDTEEQANFVEEEPDNNALDDDDGAEAENDEDENEEEVGGNDTEQKEQEQQQQQQGRGDDGVNGGDDETTEEAENNNNINGMRQEEEEQGAADAICPYGALSELTKTERYPHANDKTKRHMVDPPQGGKVALVCCMTTAGPWNFVIRHAWAPNVSVRSSSS